MKVLCKYLFVVFTPFMIWAATPSTTITSDRMEMLRFKDHNEFTFLGNVQIRSKNFYGECEQMWVYSKPNETQQINCNHWIYVKILPPFEIFQWSYLLSFKHVQTKLTLKNEPIGQIKKIVAIKRVFLEAQDPETGEVKRANSEKADIFPGEGKMVLTENPVVHSSTQGTFRGGKITFYKHSGRITVENPDNKQRSQVLLSE